MVQGSCLGPILFTIFINDIDTAVDTVNSVMSKFADDTKWGKIVEGEQDKNSFQEGINNLVKWSKDWQMMFNVDKCHIMHLGPNNKYKYTMEGEELEVSAYEKDIGVIIDSSLKPSLQCLKAAKKANSVLAQLSRAVSYRDKDTFLHLFRTYVRPYLEYCSATWCPWTKTDKEVLEKVQKRAWEW